ncbi:hypothetical protein ACSLPI_24230, partial [Escherichia coli]
MKKIGVILSGCGVYDGSEIHEAVLTLLAISRSGAQAVCFAPDKQQVDVINHLTGEAMTETRNVLIEAARITRGEIRPLAQADAAEKGTGATLNNAMPPPQKTARTTINRRRKRRTKLNTVKRL